MRALLFTVTLIVSVIPLSSNAETCTTEWRAKAEEKCSTSGTQDMARCLSATAKDADDELNRVYQILKSDLVEPEPLVKAQRSWLSYRKEECTYKSSGYVCDSGVVGMCSISTSICETHLTCERVQRLRDHIGAKCNGCPVRKSDGK